MGEVVLLTSANRAVLIKEAINNTYPVKNPMVILADLLILEAPASFIK
ncbi:hypothetical protein QY96_01726 [Bacillus thermotolerans]|nr:hypothetical protein QY96_01726 [Bacillus thermotolerans]